MNRLALARGMSTLVAELRSVHRMAGGRAMVRYAGEVLRKLPAIVRSRTLEPADEAMRHESWTLRAGARTVELDGRHWSGAREIYGRRVYLPSPEFAIEPGDRVVDLGANAGLFTLLAAANGARVLAVEAQSGFAPEIERNLDHNGLRDRATVIVALIGAGRGVFSDPEDVLSGSHGCARPPVAELGPLLERHGFDRVDFLKIDIEGSEFALLQGEIPWLDRVRRIAMEVHPAYGDVPVLAELLRSRGFRVRTTDERGFRTERPSERGGYLYALREAR
jgi:FkbM family methyltransferase